MDGLPDPTRCRSASEFAAALRSMKARAGEPSFSELAERCGIPRSTLADACARGRSSLPRLQVVRGFLAAVELPRTQAQAWERAWRRLRDDA